MTTQHASASAAHGLTWLGTRTDRPAEMSRFLADTLGIPVVERTEGYTVHALADGSQIEVFTRTDPEHRHFTTGPVPGVLVDDVHATAARLEEAGIELLGPTYEEHGHAWQHFRAPDGNVWEITHRPATTAGPAALPGHPSRTPR